MELLPVVSVFLHLSPPMFLFGHVTGGERQDPEAECRDTATGKGSSRGEDPEPSVQD